MSLCVNPKSLNILVDINLTQVYRTRSKVVNSKPVFNACTQRVMEDWRSGIVTIIVRDRRMRQHDLILGFVPLKLSGILQTSSQVTRWYPLDGGIGFGQIRLFILFRSIKTRLQSQQLGWDAGTFEFTSDKFMAKGYNMNSKHQLKLRTRSSSGKISRAHCKKTDEGDGIFWDVPKKDGKNKLQASSPISIRVTCNIQLLHFK
jgi:Ca2+-dependent lipid-binding protein